MKTRAIMNTNKGLIYIFLLIILALMMILSQPIYEMVSQKIQRQKEKELISIGDQFRNAIDNYYHWNHLNQYPQSLQDLVTDKRPLKPVHRLRRVYIDPMTGNNNWDLLKINGKIIGIHSKSHRTTIKKYGFSLDDSSFSTKKYYDEWLFTYPSEIEVN